MEKKHDDYIPSLKYDWLTRLYDPLQRWTFPELTSKNQLVNQAHIQSGYQVLDLGCGTATLAILVKKKYPEAKVFGLDADPKVLEIAKAKTTKVNLDIVYDKGMSFELPYGDESIDVVFSSLLFHHLNRDKKIRTLKEVFRVLQSSGELHVADWGKPQNVFMRIAFLPVQMLDGFETTSDNVKGLLPELFRSTGFDKVQETAKFMTLFGTFSLYKARKPD